MMKRKTLRDEIAIEAMKVFAGTTDSEGNLLFLVDVAQQSYTLASLMLVERQLYND